MSYAHKECQVVDDPLQKIASPVIDWRTTIFSISVYCSSVMFLFFHLKSQVVE